MERSLIETLKAKKKKIYVISPHFDDAILSAGALLTYLAKSNDITVINVFTEAGTHPYTLSAKAYLDQCNYKNADDLYNDRRKEDREVLGTIVKKSIDLGLVDALWRKKDKVTSLGKIVPELDHVYPTYKFHVQKGIISKNDEKTIALIKKKLSSLVEENTVIFCPMGIGDHVDHVIVHTICESLFENVIFWSDFPYDEKSTSKNETNAYQIITFSKFLKTKKELIAGYKTQFKAMFKQGLITKPETFYTKLTVEKI